MALITYQPRVSYIVLPLRPHLPKEGATQGSHISFHLFGGTTKFASLNYGQHWRAQPLIVGKGKPFKITSFKGNLQNDEAEGTDRGSGLSKKTAQLSCSRQMDEITAESPEVVQNSLNFESVDEASIASSSSIKKQFAKWLTMLRTQPPGQAKHQSKAEKLGEVGLNEALESSPELHATTASSIMKAAFSHFWKLDAAVKIPLLIFPPWYVAVRALYSADVAQELMPIWVLGPLIVALYIKIIKGLCFLYALCFKLTVSFVIHIPSFYKYYISEGRLVAYLHAHLWQPIENVKNADYKELSIRKLKELREWAIEKQLDYVESIWPYYCRTIRFLKKANLI